MRTIHVIPVADLVEHLVPGGYSPLCDDRWLMIEADPIAPDVDCPCGPIVEYVPPGGWLVTHHSLDGREQHE